MLVLPPLSSASVALVLKTTLVVALTRVLVSLATSIRRKVRAAEQLAPVPGPRGRFLLGLIPEFAKNIHRVCDFQVLWFALVVCVLIFVA